MSEPSSARPVHILGMSGSLRAASVHTALLQAARLVAAPGVVVEIYDALGALPHFNPDVEESGVLPAPVDDLRARVGRADAVVISSPEYAHGVPGALKNALDWLVGSVEFPDKPVALLGAAGRAAHATAQLEEILATMSARIVREACVSVPLSGVRPDAAAILADPARSAALVAALEVLASLVGARARDAVAATPPSAAPPAPRAGSG